jgi:hypothetical protein
MAGLMPNLDKKIFRLCMRQIHGVNYLCGLVKVTYSLYGPENFKISCMALCLNFCVLYDITVSLGG